MGVSQTSVSLPTTADPPRLQKRHNLQPAQNATAAPLKDLQTKLGMAMLFITHHLTTLPGSKLGKIHSWLLVCVRLGVKAKTASDQPANPASLHLNRSAVEDHID